MSKHLDVGSTAATHKQRYWLVAKEEDGWLGDLRRGSRSMGPWGKVLGEKTGEGESSPTLFLILSIFHIISTRVWESEQKQWAKRGRCHLGQVSAGEWDQHGCQVEGERGYLENSSANSISPHYLRSLPSHPPIVIPWHCPGQLLLETIRQTMLTKCVRHMITDQQCHTQYNHESIDTL